MKYINRESESILSKLLETGKIILVLGARQVGKTTLIKKIVEQRQKQALYLNLDIDADVSRLLAVSALPPGEAHRLLGSPDIVVLDEAQRLPKAAQIVKGWHDSGVKATIILSGSSSLDLLDKSAESLTGRNRKLFLPPLLFSEIAHSMPWFVSHQAARPAIALQTRTLLLETMVFGSYPEAVTSDGRRELLRELSADYLWKDIFQTQLVKNPALIRKLLVLLAVALASRGRSHFAAGRRA